MNAIITAFKRAASSLPSAKLFRIFIFSVVINACALGLMIYAIASLLGSFTLIGDLDSWLDVGLTSVATVIAYFLFPATMPLIVTFFDTTIAEIIEREEYPNIPSPAPPFWPTIGQDVAFTLKAIGLNIIVLPLYLIPGLNLVLYYLLNGYLLGTEFFNIIAGRHIDRVEADSMRSKNRLTIISIGALIAFGATIPIVNLFIPIFGVVMMVHYFHALKPKYKITLNAED